MPARDYYLPGRKLVSQNDSAIIANPNVPRSKFLGSWTRKTAFNAGVLVPILVDEVLPGDHLTYNVTAYVRMSTPLFPLFDNQRVDTFFFFVPCRLVWENWAKFMGEQATPAASIDYTIPQVGADGPLAINSLYDHMGIPFLTGLIPGDNEWSVNALPLRCYNLIYNTWFRDQNLQDSIPVHTDDGPDPVADYNIKHRAKAHDYFTSALPWPQKFTAPTVPLGGLAPVLGIGSPQNNAVGISPPLVRETDEGTDTYSLYKKMSDATTNGDVYLKMTTVDGIDFWPAIYADLSEATGVAVNTFRQAFQIQSLLERDARGGTRYTELIRAHFGVTNPDFRLQRPEYIGGGQTALGITPIAQTAPTEDAPLGALGGAGTAAGTHRANYAATEHGYIIGLINVRSELSYQQGLNKLYKRSTRFDFYWPELAQMGEQAIARQEIYAQGDGNGASDTAVFGYQERWHEYRTRVSDVTGIMRSDAAGTLDAWHLAQDFDTPPILDSTFIVDNPPMSRVLAAGALADKQQYLADILYHRIAVRPIPTFGTPASLGRF